MIPNVKVTKSQQGQTGVVRPGADGVMAIIASSATGTQNQPATYTRPEDIVADAGNGRLSSFAAHTLGVTGNPVVAVNPTTAQAATYGAMSVAGGGTSIPSAGATTPNDEWNVVILFTVGGTVGVAGAYYQVSLDGGDTYTAQQALGTASSIVIAGTGITVSLGAGTLITGQTISFVTTPAYPNTTDLVASLETLRVTGQPWDGVLLDTQGSTGSAAIAAQVDTWLAAMEKVGVFKFAVMSLPPKGLAPYAAAETEAAYATRLTPIIGAIDTPRVVVCAGGADMVEYFQGVKVRRPASLYIAAAIEAISIGTDPAAVANGPLTNATITDGRGNPKYHDEQIYPGLDALNISTLRSFPGRPGVFVTNARLPSAAGSDIVYVPHLRTMNKACTIAFQLLTDKLSLGVGKNPKPGPNGAIYIAERDAASIEHYVNGTLSAQLRGQVADVDLTLSRTDDISSNAGATITATLSVEPLAYIKGFNTTATFVKSITVPLAA